MQRKTVSYWTYAKITAWYKEWWVHCFSLLVYHFMALAFLVNIPFVLYFSQNPWDWEPCRETDKKLWDSGRTVRVGSCACKCWQAWVALWLTENFEQNFLWGRGEGKCKFPFVSHQDFPWGVPGPPLLRNTNPVGTLGEQRILFLLWHGVSAVSSVSENHAEWTTRACTPNGLWHELPSWANTADKVVYDYTVIIHGTIKSKGK